MTKKLGITLLPQEQELTMQFMRIKNWPINYTSQPPENSRNLKYLHLIKIKFSADLANVQLISKYKRVRLYVFLIFTANILGLLSWKTKKVLQLLMTTISKNFRCFRINDFLYVEDNDKVPNLKVGDHVRINCLVTIEATHICHLYY